METYQVKINVSLKVNAMNPEDAVKQVMMRYPNMTSTDTPGLHNTIGVRESTVTEISMLKIP